MPNSQQKRKLNSGEIAGLVLATVLIYIGGLKLLIGQEYNMPWRMIPSGLAAFIVVGCDIGWVLFVKRWQTTSVLIKGILTLLILTVSAVVLSDLYLIHVFHEMW